MSKGEARKRNDLKLRELAARLAASVGEALGSATQRSVQASLSDDLTRVDAEGWIWMLESSVAVVRGALEKPLAGRHLRIVLPEKDAIVLCEHALRVDRQVPLGHEPPETLSWHRETLRQIGEVVCQRVQSSLGTLGKHAVKVTLDAVGTIRPGFDDEGILGEGDKVFYGLRIETDGEPAEGWLVLDEVVARKWNDGKEPLVDAPQKGETVDEPEEDGEIPQARIRGRLTAFVESPEVVALLQKSGRRVGFEIDARPVGETPKPAGFSNETVLIEIPPHAGARFQWASRIKQESAAARVVLLLHDASRANVMAAIQTKSDVCVAWPITEPELSLKLEPMFPV